MSSLFGTSNIATQITRTIASGTSSIVTSDKYINYNKAGGNIIVTLPRLSVFLDAVNANGAMVNFYSGFIFSDITESVTSNTITVNCNVNDNINGLSTISISTLKNFIIYPTPSGWLLSQGSNDTSSVPAVYRALLTQAGTSAPIASVLSNSLGSIVWSYTDVGTYRATLTGAFTNASKVFIMYSANVVSVGAPAQGTMYANVINANTIEVITLSSGASNDLLNNTAIEIAVYN